MPIITSSSIITDIDPKDVREKKEKMKKAFEDAIKRVNPFKKKKKVYDSRNNTMRA